MEKKDWGSAIVSALQEALTGKLETLEALVDPNIVIHEPPYLSYGRDFHGAKGFRELFDAATEVIDASTLKVLTYAVGEDRVVLLMSARFHGSSEDSLVTEHWVIRNDKIVDVTVFWFSLPPTQMKAVAESLR